jgi:CheY-like chemotaxis protein
MAAPAVSSTGTDGAEADDGAPRVMVADDDVVEAEDGAVALEKLSTQAVRVLVLDIRMPGRDGIGVLDAMDDLPPVLLVSAFSVDQATKERIGAKVHRYLRKPVSPRLLLSCVAEASRARPPSTVPG